ncbi:MAG: HAMP domain-containing sensor histidine kinase [Pacificimonas sp.]
MSNLDSALDHLIALVGDGYRDATRPDVREHKVDLTEVIQDALSVVDLGEAAFVEFDRAGDELRVAANVGEIRQIFVNILANAKKFAPDCRVVIRVHSEDLIRITISDEGPGIPEAEREDVFKRHHRLGETAPGQGLGLSISRRLAEANGGALYVSESELGGATFVVELPHAR